jgi:hypothetical protein
VDVRGQQQQQQQQQHLLPFEPLLNFSRAETSWNIAISMLCFRNWNGKILKQKS